MKYELEVDAEEVYRQVEYRITIKNARRVWLRLSPRWLLKLAKIIYPGQIFYGGYAGSQSISQ
ncbi:MAG: hypothetical protein PHH77_09300 [Victivallaceae bacterium]|nr:hypothetical protein [Victivallaceae bacterium]